MSWKEATPMTLRDEFVALALGRELSVTELARRFGISRKTGYKWLRRHAAGEPLSDRSRKPRTSPTRTAPAQESEVVALRQAHPCWGGRKLARVLGNQGIEAVPAPSTITHILRRHDLLQEAPSATHTAWQRFEHAAPNDLWQMDFKGTIAVGQGRCDPLTVLDDHSRYNMALRANADMCGATVQEELTAVFGRYGLPRRMNMDNGSPWGIGYGQSRHLTAFTIWLVRLGIHVSFSTPAHPQTNGKDERFHRSFKAEVMRGRCFANLNEAQEAFDHWRSIYNHVRPHEGIGMAVPADRYQPSPRAFPTRLPDIEYAPDDVILRVRARGRVSFKGQPFLVSTALTGYDIAVRPRDNEDGVFDLYFAHHRLTTWNLNVTT